MRSPNATNMYSNHPVYYEYRTTGTHGVFVLNSNGMIIKMNDTAKKKTTMEYNATRIGGVIEIYFFAGSMTRALRSSSTEAIGHFGAGICIITPTE